MDNRKLDMSNEVSLAASDDMVATISAAFHDVAVLLHLSSTVRGSSAFATAGHVDLEQS